MTTRRIIFLWMILSCLPVGAFAEKAETAIAVWANEAIVSTYTYHANNFLERQKAIAKYFTAKGWITYSDALQQSGLPEAVKQNAYFVSAVATMPPEVTRLDESHWKVSMPLLVVYKNPQYQQKQTLKVSLTITKAASKQGVRGLAITSLTSTMITPSCRCDIEAETSTP